MFDAKLRGYIDPPLNRMGKALADLGITANAVTLVGLGFGLAAGQRWPLGNLTQPCCLSCSIASQTGWTEPSPERSVPRISAGFTTSHSTSSFMVQFHWPLHLSRLSRTLWPRQPYFSAFTLTVPLSLHSQHWHRSWACKPHYVARNPSIIWEGLLKALKPLVSSSHFACSPLTSHGLRGLLLRSAHFRPFLAFLWFGIWF